ncbi:MAG: RNA polymerase sigma factor [Thermoleophilia bacterium]|nr:RNA polymerase sigma factor [Thermoleophilia bacterium]
MSSSTDIATARRPSDDAALLRASDDGDDAAFRELYERHVDAITGYLVARVGPDARDDLVTETFATAWSKAGSFDPEATSARPWLFGIATMQVHRHRARERRWQAAILREATMAAPQVETDPAQLHAEAGIARAALARLTPAEREMLLLVSVGELRITEAAAAAGIRESAARMRLMRARRELTAFLDDHRIGGDHA